MLSTAAHAPSSELPSTSNTPVAQGLDGGQASAAPSAASNAGAISKLLTSVEQWVQQAPAHERGAREDARHRITVYVSPAERTPHLNLSGLGLSALPDEFRTVVMVAKLRSGNRQSAVIDLRNNSLTAQAQDTITQLSPALRPLVDIAEQASVPGTNSGLQGAAQAGAPSQPNPDLPLWLANLAAVVGRLNTDAVPMISELGLKCRDALNFPKTTLEKAMTTYNALLVEVQTKAAATDVGRLALERMPDLSFLVDHRALEDLSRMITLIDQATAKVSSASVGFFRSEKNITRALEKLTAMKQICAALENLFEQKYTCQRAATSLLDKAEGLGEALADLHTRCLQMDARGERANNDLSTLVSVLLTHTDGLKGLTHELDGLLKQYQGLLPKLDEAWPLKAGLSASLGQWAVDLATLKQHKNIGLLLGRLAKPEMGALEQSGLLPLLKNQLEHLPMGSPYLELLAKHPNEQVRGLVPAVVPASVPEPAQPTEPATDLAPAGLKRTPSETELAQFPAVNVPHTALAKVRYTAPAFEAVRQGDLAKLHEYLSLGLNPLVTNDYGDTLLHEAARYGQVTVLRWLATVQKLPLVVGDKSGRTPLHVAAINGQLQAMAALVDAGADKHAKDNEGSQAIHLAALLSNADAVKYCRDELGQSLEARGFNGRTPLVQAAENGNLAVMRWLVAQGADKHAKGDDGNQAIHWAARFSNADAVKFCRDELGQSLEARGFDGQTPLLAAAEKGNLAVMRWLVAQGADKHAKDNQGNQAIHRAALFSNADAVTFCRDELGQSLEARGFNGRTPLVQAAEKGNLAVMRWLVGAGANPRTVDSSRHTLLDRAKVSNNAETIAYVEQLLRIRP